jgi:hypothetical protein
MRFIVLVKHTPDVYDQKPREADLAVMGAFNDELVKAGMMLEAAGLVAQATRIEFFRGGNPKITDGPFTEAKEIVAGFWIIDAKSQEDAVAWMRRAPFDKMHDHAAIEIRRLWTDEDFA